MEYMALTKDLIYAILMFASVVTGAVTFEFLVEKRRLRRLSHTARGYWREAGSLLASRRNGGQAFAPSVAETDLMLFLKENAHPVSSFLLKRITGPVVSSSPIEVELFISRVERGRQRLMNLVALVAPSIGLAGTVVAIMDGLTGGALNQGGDAFVASLGYALKTTLFGIAISIWARINASLLIEPVLDQLERDCLTGGVELVSQNTVKKSMVGESRTNFLQERVPELVRSDQGGANVNTQ